MVAVAFVLAAALTWRKWPDVLVDFGTQLYMPWRISLGAVLYRNLFYFSGGPFSQYFNALLFKIFGVSFSTLIAANLILAAAMIFVVYRRFCAAANAATATLMGLGIVLIFAFGQYVQIGNYNYIAPYTHEATHGLIFSIFAIALLSDWIAGGKIRAALAAGFFAGIVFLTKPDICTALAVAVLGAFILYGFKWGRKKLVSSLPAFVCAGAIPSLFFFFFFLHTENARESFRSVVFDWLPIVQGKITNNAFYLWCTGLDAPLAHLREIILYFLAVALAVAVYAFVLRWTRNWKLKGINSPLVILLLLILPLLIWAGRFDWVQCGWPLPPLCLCACGFIAWKYKTAEQPPVFPLLWSIFALVLLAKLGLFPRIFHYGFALAMPAFVSSIYLLYWLLPDWLEKKFQVPRRSFRFAIALVLLIGFANLFDQSLLLYAKKTLPVGSGGDKIFTYNSDARDIKNPDTGRDINAALAWTEKNLPPGATFAVVPEGEMLNYLTRRANPTPCLFWDLNSVTVIGQSTMTAAFEQGAPDYVFIVERDSSEFQIGYFGSSPDFGQPLMQWVRKNYRPEILFGSEPLKNGQFGIKILKRIPASH